MVAVEPTLAKNSLQEMKSEERTNELARSFGWEELVCGRSAVWRRGATFIFLLAALRSRMRCLTPLPLSQSKAVHYVRSQRQASAHNAPEGRSRSGSEDSCSVPTK